MDIIYLWRKNELYKEKVGVREICQESYKEGIKRINGCIEIEMYSDTYLFKGCALHDVTVKIFDNFFAFKTGSIRVHNV